VDNPSTYLTFVPSVISDHVKLSLKEVKAMTQQLVSPDTRAVEAIQDAIDGNGYDRKALPPLVADVDMFRSEFMPALEQNLMQELEEKKFIEPEQSRTKASDSKSNKYALER